MTEAKRSKPTYNMAQNAFYMVRLAWGKRKTVLWFCLILALQIGRASCRERV